MSQLIQLQLTLIKNAIFRKIKTKITFNTTYYVECIDLHTQWVPIVNSNTILHQLKFNVSI